MTMARLTADERPELVFEFRVLRSWIERLRGLLGTSAAAAPVALLKCGSVHTFGMSYPLDLAFIGELGEVLKVVRAVPPGEAHACLGAAVTLERPADADRPWPQLGEHLWICAMSAGF